MPLIPPWPRRQPKRQPAPPTGPRLSTVDEQRAEAKRLLLKCDTGHGCEVRLLLVDFLDGPNGVDLSPRGGELAAEVTRRTGVPHVYEDQRRMIRPEADTQ